MDEGNLQNANKFNPGEVKEQFENKGLESNIKVESDKEMQEKYGGWLGASLVTEGERKVENIQNIIETGKKLKSEYDKMNEFQQLPLEEQLTKIEKEKAEEQKAEEDAKKAEQAEQERIENLKKQYIVNAAIIECSCSPDRSYIILPVSHGQYINDIAQLNVEDCVPNINIMNFKVCQSPSNPSVKEAAKEVLKKAQDRSKGFFDRVMDLFAKPNEIDENKIDKELLERCAGECKCWIDGGLKWIDGEKTVLIDGKPALLGRCTTMCGFGGVIKFYTCGQEK